MKPPTVIIMGMSVIGMVLSSPLHAEDQPLRKSGIGPAMLPVELANPGVESISDEELLKRRGAASTQPFSGKPLPPKDSDYSLVALSCFLESNGHSTMLPKDSIIYCPGESATRRVTRPTSKLVPWPEFLMKNRNWIHCIEVSGSQIRGESAVPEETLAACRKLKVLAVACFHGNPVTVLPVKSLP